MNVYALWFWVMAGALLAAAVWAILRPLLKREAASESATDDLSLEIYRARFTELDDDISGGSVSAAEKDIVVSELERDLLRAAERGPVDATAPKGSRNRMVAAMLALLLPALVVGLYFALGRPDVARDIAGAEAEMKSAHLASIESMVEGLAARMEQQPDDRQGWEMLARSYMVLGRYAEAVVAAEKLYALAGDEPEVLLRLADALSMANGGDLAGRPAELVQKALVLDPNHPTALWLAGAAAAESGNHGAATAFWERLLPLVANEPEFRAQVAEAIANVRLAAGDAGSAQQPGSNAGAIRIRVELAPSLADQADPDSTVFIIARASEGAAMPLAVQRRTVKELPLDATLDDSLSMSDAAKLSDFTTIDLSARVSHSGRAGRESGDLIGELRGVTVGADTPANIIIDTRVP
ncbi:MAG: c-type cytochrome biogenesis protein CcmI [Gammaproteobacteria bacterium]|nr:c-type cytochrome biogenesis protein CcmI [Gammaproteobacteria bacterium]